MKKIKITISNEPCDYLEDDLPAEIDFSKMKRIENPVKENKNIPIVLEPDIAKHFSSSKKLNQFLRLQLKSFENMS